jgi:SAM-dependent methyltransferase
LEELIAAYPEVYAFDQAPQTGGLSRLLYKFETILFYHPIYRHCARQTTGLTGLRGGRLLDIGGGTGHRTRFFQRLGFRCLVLDVDPRPLQIAQARFGLPAVQALPEELPLVYGSLDLITFFYVVEHLLDPSRALRAAYHALRPGGWVAIAVPLISGGQARWLGPRWSAVTEAPRHVSLPTPEGMRRLLERSGFQLQQWDGMHPLDEAGVLSLSILPAASSAIACAASVRTSLRAIRLAGGILTLTLWPLSLILRARFGPSLGIFFGRKA